MLVRFIEISRILFLLNCESRVWYYFAVWLISTFHCAQYDTAIPFPFVFGTWKHNISPPKSQLTRKKNHQFNLIFFVFILKFLSLAKKLIERWELCVSQFYLKEPFILVYDLRVIVSNHSVLWIWCLAVYFFMFFLSMNSSFCNGFLTQYSLCKVDHI